MQPITIDLFAVDFDQYGTLVLSDDDGMMELTVQLRNQDALTLVLRDDEVQQLIDALQEYQAIRQGEVFVPAVVPSSDELKTWWVGNHE